jgi:hypothetical protein
VIARVMLRRPTATTARISDSSAAAPAVVQPMPIRSMIGPWTSEPIG